MSDAAHPWSIEDNAIFRKLYKKYVKVTNVADTVNSRIEDLRTASEPARLGDKKHAPYRNTYGINITKSVRLLYTINYKEHKILLVAIGDHKEVYRRG